MVGWHHRPNVQGFGWTPGVGDGQGGLACCNPWGHKDLNMTELTAFFMVQLSHPYMTTGKTIALTILTFVSKMMSQLFNMLSRFAMLFLPRSKHLLILWLQSLSAVILEPEKI